MVNYEDNPPKSFWDIFPKEQLPSEVVQSINVSELDILIEKKKDLLTFSEYNRAKTCVSNLKFGASSFQKTYLPPCLVKNSANAKKFAEEITDTIAWWVKMKFVAGPFESPPLKDFRVNALHAVDQGEKIRPVLNVSLPENGSLNSNMNLFSLEKVYMSNARRFGFSLREAGRNAKMTKFDLVDAYKNVPAKMSELRLQGFSWLGKYFLELRQIFGIKSAVPNFDILGNTLFVLTVAGELFIHNFFHRALDDVPYVAPANSNWCEKFTVKYKKICDSVNVKLAQNCPKFEKAFCNSTFGKVLGIFFDSKTMKWYMPNDKRLKALMGVVNALQKENHSLLEIQELLGRLNHVCQMCPFMKIFMFPLYSTLTGSEGVSTITLSHVAKRDLSVWGNFLAKDNVWLPICSRYYSPPLSYKSFSSDAAGGTGLPGEGGFVGCGNVGFDHLGVIIFAYQLFWPEGILSATYDSKGSRLGNKSTTLEFLGVIIPFVVIPEQLMNQHIVVKVDNVACFYGWLNRHTTGDNMASILIRALHLICAHLGCQVHFEHLPRKTTWDAHLVDRMSRAKSTTRNDRKLLDSFVLPPVPSALLNWMEKPWEDWDLARKLLNHVIEKCRAV